MAFEMKTLCLAWLVVLEFGVSLNAAENHLLILSGQSNMERLDPGLSFTPTVEAAFGRERVVVVKDAQSGQPIRRWYKGWKPAHGAPPGSTGDLYDRLMQQVHEAIQERRFDTVTLVWMQGERDAKEQHGEVYAESLRGLVDQLSKDLGRDHVNLVIGRLSDFDLSNTRYRHWTVVRDAQVEVAESDPHAAWVDTDDLNDGLSKKGKLLKNDLHYTPDGYKILGERFAEQAIKLIQEEPQP
ncbi:hypothetical protein Pla123a_47280 [Posidoniimonas polymericola]|uniref:Sialate O-acetylesterase domain-containing protein n=1 Tax=Posidoniimonas polymericola TaxID=2528002 RepID=A0A5C5XTW8_9BACT|nr:sialate O-acetylesterase [Posidoniimonas polymericola]TWT66334.1 hypothetical protein Pla123a_47280 [Posidoniimonas polymericola]